MRTNSSVLMLGTGLRRDNVEGEGCSTSVELPWSCCSPRVHSREIVQPPAAVCDCEDGEVFEKNFTSPGLCGFELCLSEMAESHHRSLELFFFFFVVEKVKLKSQEAMLRGLLLEAF